jgi:5-hydroxyisourate hydrolase
MPRSPITTHVLDVARGRPAEGVAVMLEFMEAGAWKELAAGKTDADGRAMNLLPEDTKLMIGVYRLTFDTLTYHAQVGEGGFYPYVPVIFEVADTTQHYHVPLLLSPFGYSTYRGS